MRHACGGDTMKTKKLDKILELHTDHAIAKEKDVDIKQVERIDTTPIPITEPTGARSKERHNRRSKQIGMVDNFTEGLKLQQV